LNVLTGNKPSLSELMITAFSQFGTHQVWGAAGAEDTSTLFTVPLRPGTYLQAARKVGRKGAGEIMVNIILHFANC
jgi:hypothetical protein